MTKEMYEDLLERNKLQISELNILTEEQDRHIVELEKENTELKTKKIPQLERKIASIRGCHSVAVKKLNARIEQVERLKKENAELRQKLRSKLCLRKKQKIVLIVRKFCTNGKLISILI